VQFPNSFWDELPYQRIELLRWTQSSYGSRCTCDPAPMWYPIWDDR
jgi:hypothetical protein